MKNETNQLSEFREVARSFVQKLDALRDALDYVMAISTTLKEEAARDHLKLLERYGTPLPPEDDGLKRFKIPAEHRRKVARQGEKYEKSEKAMVLLPRKFLVSFVSEFDALMGGLLREIYATQPGMLLASERVLTFKELVSFSTLEDAKDSLIETEVESHLRESHIKQFRALEGKLGIKLTEGLSSWATFVELTQRRNLFVHADGVSSLQYKRVCSENSALPPNFVLGDILDAPREYLINSYKCLYEIGIKLCQVIWRKMVPTEVERADNALNEICYELLVAEKYDLATRLLEFSVEVIKKHSNEKLKRIFLVNLAQAYKFGPSEKSPNEVMKKIDWSAAGDDFKLCICVLSDDFSAAAKVMHRIGRDGVVNTAAYLDWPIFKIFRETEEFRVAYKNIFGVDPDGEVTVSATELETGKANDGAVG